jgi:hypothetical protein
MTGETITEARSERSAGRRIQTGIVMVLGGSAVAVAGWLCLHLLAARSARMSRVAALVERMKGPSETEALQAYRDLAWLDVELLDGILPFVTSREPTPIDSLPTPWGTFAGKKYSVGEIASLILAWRGEGDPQKGIQAALRSDPDLEGLCRRWVEEAMKEPR